MEQPSNHWPEEKEPPKLKIYFLPNLELGNFTQIRAALFFILLACIFDLFDGRVARMGGRESPFGREFDSLADIISFGVAPTFLVHRVVLGEAFPGHADWGWVIASIY